MTRHLPAGRVAVPTLVILALLCSASGASGQAGGISASASAQIAALFQEKESRTPAQRKIDSNLLYAARMYRHQAAAPGVPVLETGIEVLSEGRVTVDVSARVTETLLEQIRSTGARIVNGRAGFPSVRAEVAIDDLESIALMPGVIFVNHLQRSNVSGGGASPGVLKEMVESGLRAGAIRRPAVAAADEITEGRITHRADLVTTALGYSGAGTSIGVLSDGVAVLRSIERFDDLPVTVLPGQAGHGSEGSAMLRILHDIAPSARLFFATAIPTAAQFAQNIRDLRAAGCDVIVDDVGYFAESPFQRGQGPGVASTTNGGIVTQAVADVTAAGALYFSAAGDQGNADDNTAGTWEGDFVDGGPVGSPIPGTGNFHMFAPAQNYNVLSVKGKVVHLFWSDPLGGSGNDYDLFVLNSDGTAVVASSTNVQTGAQDPYEECPGTVTSGSRIVVVRRPGAAARFLRVGSFGGRLSVFSSGDTYGHNATPVPFGFTVAATPAHFAFVSSSYPPGPTGPYPDPFNPTNESEVFTSDGPRRIFFDADGSAITAGNSSSTGGLLFQKPDFTAADGVHCAPAEFWRFYGTSAAAPHAAAIAALLQSANPAFTRSDIQAALVSSAIDIEAPGVDRDTGAGILDAFAAMNVLGATAQAALLVENVTLTEVEGDRNGFVEPGECGGLSLQLTNASAAIGATAVSASLATTTPGVTISESTSAYPDIAPGSSAANTTNFQFSIANTLSCPVLIDFTLTVRFNGASTPTVLPFQVRAGKPLVSVVTTLDATPPPPGPYIATTGYQTGSAVSDGITSNCGSRKATPRMYDTSNHRYDAYTFTNCSSNTICARVTVSQGGDVFWSNDVFSATYSSYDPAHPDTGYLADSGVPASIGEQAWYSFEVAPGASFTTVVYLTYIPFETPYSLTVDGLCLPCTTYTGGGCGGFFCPAITISPETLPAARTGEPYDQLLTPSGGVAPYSFTVTGLPAGLEATPSGSGTGVRIAGTPTAAFDGTVTVTVSGTDSNGCPFSKSYPLTITCPRCGARDFYTITPCRVVDTRWPDGPYGGPAIVGNDYRRAFTIAGQCGVPTTAKAVAVNVTVTRPTNDGFVTVLPDDLHRTTSNVNFRAGQTRAANAIVALDPSGAVVVRCGMIPGTVDVILDVVGYFQ